MTLKLPISAESIVACEPVNWVFARLVKVALSPEDITAFVIAILPIVAESIVALVPVIAFAVSTEFAMFVIVALSPTKVVLVIAFAVKTEFAILVIVALSPNAESKFINSVLTCRISELSTFKLLIVALSDVICEDVNCVFAKFIIVAESIVTAPACIVLWAELSKVALSTVNWLLARLVIVALSFALDLSNSWCHAPPWAK